jgi:hypothetical protein
VKLVFAKIAIGVVSLIALIFSPIADLHPMARGMSPMHHLAVPYGFEESDIPNLSGKHFLVTGANVSGARPVIAFTCWLT